MTPTVIKKIINSVNVASLKPKYWLKRMGIKKLAERIPAS